MRDGDEVNGVGQGYSRPEDINSVVASEASWECPSGPYQKNGCRRRFYMLCSKFLYVDLIAYNIILLDAYSLTNAIVSFPEVQAAVSALKYFSGLPELPRGYFIPPTRNANILDEAAVQAVFLNLVAVSNKKKLLYVSLYFLIWVKPQILVRPTVAKLARDGQLYDGWLTVAILRKVLKEIPEEPKKDLDHARSSIQKLGKGGRGQKMREKPKKLKMRSRTRDMAKILRVGCDYGYLAGVTSSHQYGNSGSLNMVDLLADMGSRHD
ncbi:hypothetical protein Fmac_021868 [Flemingia macrophylla]|uniref:Uncharacterized protein n=1 Tax=Flemingia macrophylla TaxID=520843 RepID=A0ABD1LY90_9FABA